MEKRMISVILILIIFIGVCGYLLYLPDPEVVDLDKDNKRTQSCMVTEEPSLDDYHSNTFRSTMCEEIENSVPESYISNVLNVPCILQNPELPTGCEVTSLDIVLNYYGFNIDKCDLADNYLDKGPVGSTDFHSAFVGNPRYNSSYGCYSPVITNCANKYLQEVGSSLTATDISGTEFTDLFNEIDRGNPVLIWVTMYMTHPFDTTTWNIDGNTIRWRANEHCIVLIGYDKDADIVYVADPLVGNTTYDINIISERYTQLFSQAVVLK